MKASSTGDLEAVPALYEPAAHCVVAPGHIVSGSEAMRQVLHQFLMGQPTLTLKKVTAMQAGDIALLTSTWPLTSTDPGGNPVAVTG